MTMCKLKSFKGFNVNQHCCCVEKQYMYHTCAGSTCEDRIFCRQNRSLYVGMEYGELCHDMSFDIYVGCIQGSLEECQNLNRRKARYNMHVRLSKCLKM
ncbi:hypothetical protein KUTeg_010686 [Tegillarca granosa]|uniref:Uncharacterized protein n=1 Tax=Tegillarca granosa TaxID=220873 RepID=A0ABQ9F1Q4_TEGGR|nr:hypothetical protein KUTeg_010686 [Tegillarca granosa]